MRASNSQGRFSDQRAIARRPASQQEQQPNVLLAARSEQQEGSHEAQDAVAMSLLPDEDGSHIMSHMTSASAADISGASSSSSVSSARSQGTKRTRSDESQSASTDRCTSPPRKSVCCDRSSDGTDACSSASASLSISDKPIGVSSGPSLDIQRYVEEVSSKATSEVVAMEIDGSDISTDRTRLSPRKKFTHPVNHSSSSSLSSSTEPGCITADSGEPSELVNASGDDGYAGEIDSDDDNDDGEVIAATGAGGVGDLVDADNDDDESEDDAANGDASNDEGNEEDDADEEGNDDDESEDDDDDDDDESVDNDDGDSEDDAANGDASNDEGNEEDDADEEDNDDDESEDDVNRDPAARFFDNIADDDEARGHRSAVAAADSEDSDRVDAKSGEDEHQDDSDDEVLGVPEAINARRNTGRRKQVLAEFIRSDGASHFRWVRSSKVENTTAMNEWVNWLRKEFVKSEMHHFFRACLVPLRDAERCSPGERAAWERKDPKSRSLASYQVYLNWFKLHNKRKHRFRDAFDYKECKSHLEAIEARMMVVLPHRAIRD